MLGVFDETDEWCKQRWTCGLTSGSSLLEKNGQGYVKQKRLFERQEIPPRKDENMSENDTVGISS